MSLSRKWVIGSIFFVLCIVILSVGYKGHHTMESRVQALESMLVVKDLQADIDKYYKQYSALPSADNEIYQGVNDLFHNHIDKGDVSINIKTGKISVNFSNGKHKGKVIYFIPQLDESKSSITWKCDRGTLPEKYVTQFCRTT